MEGTAQPPEHHDIKLWDTLYTGTISDLSAGYEGFLLKLFSLKIFLTWHSWNGYLLERKTNARPRKAQEKIKPVSYVARLLYSM